MKYMIIALLSISLVLITYKLYSSVSVVILTVCEEASDSYAAVRPAANVLDIGTNIIIEALPVRESLKEVKREILPFLDQLLNNCSD